MERNLRLSLDIPFWVRISNELFQSLYEDIVRIHKEYNFFRLTLLMMTHPFHFSTLPMLIITHLTFLYLLYAAIRQGKVISYLLLQFIAFSPLWAHILMEIMGHRYLTTYLPAIAFTLAISWSKIKLKDTPRL